VSISGEGEENKAFINDEVEMSTDKFQEIPANNGGKNNKAYQMEDILKFTQNSASSPTKNGTAGGVIRVKEISEVSRTSGKETSVL